jgi:hypothetical protein
LPILPGADPKSVVCEFFKKGQCTKGNKCKFSHDVTIERKAATIDMYNDPRDLQKGGMESWDQTTLEQVVGQKHKEHGKSEKVRAKVLSLTQGISPCGVK